MYQEMPSYLPPGWNIGDPPMYDPNGYIGNLIDSSTERGLTLSQQFQSGSLSPYGYIVGDNVTARPAYQYGLPGQPPPGAIAAMASQYDTVSQQNAEAELLRAMVLMDEADAKLMTALLLMLF